MVYSFVFKRYALFLAVFAGTAGVTLAQGVTTHQSLRIIHPSDNTKAILLQPPSNISGYDLTLPPSQGPANSLLLNDGSGLLSWASASSLVTSNAWSLAGNTGTTEPGTLGSAVTGNVVGTSGTGASARTLGFATNNTVQMTIATDGTVSTNRDMVINNVQVGRGANNITSNTAFGTLALRLATGGSNTIVGFQSAAFLTTGTRNTGVGSGVFASNVTGRGNTVLGFGAGGLITQDSNIAIGVSAGFNGGSRNVAIGTEAGINFPPGVNDQLAIANNQDEALIYGNFATRRVGIWARSGSALEMGAALQVNAYDSVTKGLIIKSAANATANLLELQNNAGAVQVSIGASGATTVGGTLTLSSTASAAVADSVLMINSSGQVTKTTRTALLAGSASWSLTGNSGTTNAGALNSSPTGNFLGTTGIGANARNLGFVTQNLVRMLIDTGGTVTFAKDMNIKDLYIGNGDDLGGWQSNIAIGTYSMGVPGQRYRSSGNNIGIGNSTLWNLGLGTGNVAIGTSSLYANQNPSYNTAVGHTAMEYHAWGEFNTAVGAEAGRNSNDLSTASNGHYFSTFLGAQTYSQNDFDTNTIVIGYRARGIGSNSAVLGNNEVKKTRLKGRVGIGADPTINAVDAQLQVSAEDSLRTGMVIKGAAMQVGNLLELQNSSGAAQLSVGPSGVTTIGGTLTLSSTASAAATDSVLMINNSGQVTKTGRAALLSGANAWTLSGNNTTDAWNGTSGARIGTTSAQPLVLATTNATAQDIIFFTGASGANERMRIGASGGITVAGALTAQTSTSTQDQLVLQAAATGSSRFAGTITNADLTAARTYTLPDASGTLAVSAAGNIALSAAGQISFAGTLPVGSGGTGATTLTGMIKGNGESAMSAVTGTMGGVTYWSDANTIASSAAGTTGQALVSGGTGVPAWYGPTPGSILFAGAGGILQQDNASLFFDDANNRLGIGDITPAAMLTVGANDAFQVNASGAITAVTGISTTGGYTQSGSNANTLSGATTVGGTLTLSSVASAAAADSVLLINSSGQVTKTTRATFLSGVNAWTLSGNAGTTDGGALGGAPTGSFLGTTGTTANARNLSFVTNNVIRAQISTTGVLSTQNDMVVNGLAVGRGAGNVNTNTVLGVSALSGLNTGGQNTVVGESSMVSNTTGNNNAALGNYTLYNNSTGYSNTAIGSYTLFANTSGAVNTAIGKYAMLNNKSGTSNTAVGATALYSDTSGSQNNAFGAGAAYQTTSGNFNIAIGNDALKENTTGSYNIAIGRSSGTMSPTLSLNKTGNNNIYIGGNIYTFADGQTNEIVIGHSAYGLGSNSVILGNGNIAATRLQGNVGIGADPTTTAGDARLQVTVANATSRGLTITGAASQSANLFEARNSTNAVLASISSAGGASFAADITVNGIRIGKGLGDNAENTVLGATALNANTTGYGNVAVGVQTLTATTTGYYNTATGAYALRNTIDGANNTAVGTIALRANTSGSQNTAVGSTALWSSTTASGNTAVGASALMNSITGESNVAVGRSALNPNTTGSNNVAIGFNAGSRLSDGTTANQTGSNNVFIGSSTLSGGASAAVGATNEIVIGAEAIGLGANSAILGNSSITATRLQGNVGIGANPTTTAGDARLQVTVANASSRGLTITGAASQTANLFEARNSGGMAQFSIGPTGATIVGGTLTLSSTASAAAADSVLMINSSNEVTKTSRANLLAGSSGWALTGNNGTSNGGSLGTTASGNVIGTTGTGSAARSLSFVTQNIIRIQIDTAGETSFLMGIKAGGVHIGTGSGNNAANAALGADALLSNTVGSANTAMGQFTLKANSNGGFNTAVGHQALQSVNQSRNTAVGAGAFSALTSGSDNVAIGYEAGKDILPGPTLNTSSQQIVLIGSNSRTLAIGDTNEIVIGASSRGLGSYSAVIGNSSITRTRLQGFVGIGDDPTNSTGSAQLQVTSANVGNKGIVVKGATAQTANLLELQNNAGTTLLSVGPSGATTVSGTLTLSNTASALAADSVLMINSSNQVTKTSRAALLSGTASTLSSLNAATSTNSINNADFAQTWQWNSLSSNSALSLSSTSTAAASNTQTLLNLSLSGANTTSSQTTYGLQVSNTHTGTSSSNVAALFSATGGTNNYGLIVSNGSVGIGTSTPALPVHAVSTAAGTNAIVDVLRLDYQSSGTPAVGIGTGMEFATETAVNNTEIGAVIEAVTTNVTNNAENFDFVFRLMQNGTAAGEKMRISSGGNVTATAFFETSDARLKDIVYRDGDVVYFKWKDRRDERIHIGYLAQDVQKNLPDQVQVDTKGMMSVNYIEVLVAKIRELEKRVEELERKYQADHK